MSSKSPIVHKRESLRKLTRSRGANRPFRHSPSNIYSDNEHSSSPLRLSIKLPGASIKKLSSMKSCEESPYSSQGETRLDYESEGSSRSSTPPLSLSVSIPNNFRKPDSSPAQPMYEDYLSGDSDDNANYYDDDMLDDLSQYSSRSSQLNSNANSRILTSRQKALAGKEATTELLELPYYDTPKEVTQAMKDKKAEQARQRRIYNQKQQEKNKEETIKKLLSRQTTKKKENKPTRYNPNVDYVSYISNKDGITLSFPESFECPLKPQTSSQHPSPKVKPPCAAANCSSISKYMEPKTLTPFCSLSCYKAITQLIS